MVKKLLYVASLVVIVCPFAAQVASTHFDGKTWWDFVKVLADDNMECRETGSAALQRAEAYLVDRLRLAGNQPTGTDNFYQTAKFKSRQTIEKDSSLALV